MRWRHYVTAEDLTSSSVHTYASDKAEYYTEKSRSARENVERFVCGAEQGVESHGRSRAE